MWGSGEPQNGYFDAELLDGRRGLVPATFVQRLIGTYIPETWIQRKIDEQIERIGYLRWMSPAGQMR